MNARQSRLPFCSDAKKLRYCYISSRNIDDQRILQSDWCFWCLTCEP